MAEKMTAEAFANTLAMPVETLLAHSKSAHMRVGSADAELSPQQQQKLQAFIESQQEAATKPADDKKLPAKKTLSLGKKLSLGDKTENKSDSSDDTTAVPDKITLRRKTSGTLNITGSQGDRQTVGIKVLKKRTYVKREETPVVEEAPSEPVVEEAPKPVEPPKKAIKITDNKPGVIKSAKQTPRKPLEKKEAAKPETKAAAPKPKPAQTAKSFKTPDQQKKTDDFEEKEREKRKKRSRQHDEAKHQKHRLDIRNINLDEEKGDGEEVDYFSGGHRTGGGKSSRTQAFEKPTKKIVYDVKIPDVIVVSELAQRLRVKAPEVIRELMKLGTMATINQSIDQDTAVIVVEEMGHTPVLVHADAVEESLLDIDEEAGEQAARPPVVTIMGHVDHGKTTLLDYIRRTKVAAGEAGGITQNIGAYHVETSRGVVTFLDTPGHEAFTAMRARGAKATDLVVLVVAADDGVMPQTIEAISHAKAASVPILVAVNKMDKPEADPDKIKTELSNHEVISEEWGGDVIFAPISAKTGDGVDTLLDSISLQAELLELKARHEGAAQGIVVEGRIDRGRGVVATVLVQSGTLQKGDILVAGTETGRVRAMLNEVGRPIKTAGPSIPVEVLGLSDMPQAGDDFAVVGSERRAREIATFRSERMKNDELKAHHAAKLEDVFANLKQGEKTALNILIKADVQGSVEALHDSLVKLSNDEINVNVISKGVGGISSSDVSLALASEAIIMAFNVRADVAARQFIDREDLEVHYHSVIYDAIDEVKRAVNGLLEPEFKETFIGLAEVKDIFRSSKLGAIAGCIVIDGMVKRNKPIRILRDNVVIYEGELESLRRSKDDVNEVKKGIECGIGVKDYNDIKVGDQIEVFDTVKTERS
jgi:translation initiation factor IF-2